MSQLPPNTYVMTLAVTLTLPAGETPEDQDPGLVVTGWDFDPWPGVQIHDVEMVSHRAADATERKETLIVRAISTADASGEGRG